MNESQTLFASSLSRFYTFAISGKAKTTSEKMSDNDKTRSLQSDVWCSGRPQWRT
uniref:Uncharacterized protein n=1 Tax=uncultured gamma proteobacterium HF0130_26L16 TaxID=723569 RepID=E7C377_9GAMM|nr:hypothetical protein [uncultured gamma proteobacterium HF0130_26L16]